MGTVTLIDGTQVDSTSEAWRHECEARAVLAMPNKQARREYIWGWFDPHTKRKQRGVADVRGKEAAEALSAKVWEI